MKICKDCGIEKPLERFTTTGPKKYKSNFCKECTASKKKEWASDNWRNYLSCVISHRKRNKEITPDECMDILVKQNYKCALTGVELTNIRGKGKVLTNASLDQIKHSGGYNKNNVRIVCYIVNVMRNTMEDTELVEWCHKIINGSTEKKAY